MSDKIITLKQKDTGDRLLPKTVKEAILDLTIDQEYDPESANPQSGLAIAEAGFGNVKSVNNFEPDENGNIELQIPSEQVQSDWEQTLSSAKSYIKNKPNLSLKQDTLVSGTNIKTINNNSILGSGNLALDGLPSQTGQSGKFLTTDGTDASWAEVQAGDSLPDQTGHSGDLLTTDGTDASWTTTAEVYPVVETYSNGTSWYRIYAPDSTGYQWCEQGGKYTVASSSPHTMNLLKEMKDTSYNITLTAGGAGAGDATVQINVRTDLITTTSFAIQKQWASNIGYYFWEVKGYIEVE